ncbi:peptide ABC transporter substrate-binding protein [Streptomyces fumigatiscleroticus]|nr:peptide ABC transporter substrate-binding protein [Streptomyces fumigatiscleroticus]
MALRPFPGCRPARRRPRRPATRFRATVAAALAVVVVAAGCSGGGDKARHGDTFVYLSNEAIVTEWDPARSYSDEVVALSNLYETLTRYNARTGRAEGLLATSWTSSRDRRTWTFTLRPGVTFHSGRPLTARAVKAAVERTRELKSGASYLWDPVRRITPLGTRKVRFELSRPASLDIIASASYAAYIYEVSDDPGYYRAAGRGTGPYTVGSWKPGAENELELTAYQDYWGGWDGDRYTEAVFRVVPQPSTTAQLMRSGEGDYAESLPPQLLDTLRGRPGLAVRERPSWQTLLGLLNTRRKPLDDVRVRRAIAQGLDYEELVAVNRGAYVASDGVVPEGLLGHTDRLDLPGDDQDQARKLLAQAGYGPGSGRTVELELTYPEGEDTIRTMAGLMKAQLRPLGVDLKPVGLPWGSVQWPRARSADPDERQDVFVMFWWPDDAEPLSYFRNVFRTEKEISYNLAYYSNPALDRLIDRVGAQTATDPDGAERTYRTMQEMLIADAPALFLGTMTYQRVLSSRVEGFTDNPAYANVVFFHELTRVRA